MSLDDGLASRLFKKLKGYPLLQERHIVETQGSEPGHTETITDIYTPKGLLHQNYSLKQSAVKLSFEKD